MILCTENFLTLITSPCSAAAVIIAPSRKTEWSRRPNCLTAPSSLDASVIRIRPMSCKIYNTWINTNPQQSLKTAGWLRRPRAVLSWQGNLLDATFSMYASGHKSIKWICCFVWHQRYEDPETSAVYLWRRQGDAQYGYLLCHLTRVLYWDARVWGSIMRKWSSPNPKSGWNRGFSTPWAFKLDRLHPFKPLLFSKISNFFTFILGGQFLLPQRANNGKREFIQLQKWMIQRVFSAWGIKTGPCAAL